MCGMVPLSGTVEFWIILDEKNLVTLSDSLQPGELVRTATLPQLEIMNFWASINFIIQGLFCQVLWISLEARKGGEQGRHTS